MKKICTTLCLLSFTTLFAIAPNQMGDDSNDGIQQSNLKLSLVARKSYRISCALAARHV
ncbi:MAG TPA: hypothetical protein PLY93_06220 [Turneriella sp.]|nr:hypothetical protein [Turneriella sp.]